MGIAMMLLVLGSSVLSAQSTSPGSIQGTVTDDRNKPIAGALVTITRTFATPKDGDHALQPVREGRQRWQLPGARLASRKLFVLRAGAR